MPMSKNYNAWKYEEISEIPNRSIAEYWGIDRNSKKKMGARKKNMHVFLRFEKFSKSYFREEVWPPFS